jgi:hypothetical protein
MPSKIAMLGSCCCSLDRPRRNPSRNSALDAVPAPSGFRLTLLLREPGKEFATPSESGSAREWQRGANRYIGAGDGLAQARAVTSLPSSPQSTIPAITRACSPVIVVFCLLLPMEGDTQSKSSDRCCAPSALNAKREAYYAVGYQNQSIGRATEVSEQQTASMCGQNHRVSCNNLSTIERVGGE